jgi:glycerophosphoryl diester phosphodiesterase
MPEHTMPARHGAAFGMVVAALLAVGYLGIRPVTANAAGREHQQPPSAQGLAARTGPASRSGLGAAEGTPAPPAPPNRPGRPHVGRGRGPDAPTGRDSFVLAHRGGTERAPENSMAAFDDAIAIGVDYIETDVRHSADGVAFLVHDPLLPRRCGAYAGQAVNLLTAAQLAKVRCAGQPLPRLTDLVDRLLRPDAVNVSVMAEVKDTDPLGIRDTLAPLGWRRVLVESFNLAALHRIEVATPQVRTCAIFVSAATLADALAVTHDCVAPEQSAVSPALVDKAHRAGAIVLPWTVDDPATMARFVALGCDGLITDRPRTAPR